MPERILIQDEAQLGETASTILKKVPDSKVFIFYGEMGAGKTTLITQMVKMLGSKDTVQSPTYSIIHEYHANETIIYHLDLFRLKNREEAFNAGVMECLNSGHYCMIEWPEMIEEWLPADRVSIRISTLPDSSRELLVLSGTEK